MDLFLSYLDLLIHIDRVLRTVIAQYGSLGYGLIFLIIFIETGIVFMPFLPGDSLVFMIGTLCGLNLMDTTTSALTCLMAAIAGDQVNFWLARTLGHRLVTNHPTWVSKDRLSQTQQFFERFGPLTLVIARFLPFVRTFAPFCAGIAFMPRWRFAMFNVLGAFLWILGVGGMGYFLGEVPWIQSHVELVIWSLILIPGLTSLIGVLKQTATRP